MKVGLIAGGGDLPHHVVEGTKAAGYDICVIALEGSVKPGAFGPDTTSYKIAEFGKQTKTFKKAGCTHICFAGNVDRPDFATLRPDWKGLRKIPGAIKAAAQGDDGLLSYVLGAYEKDGFEIIAPQELCAHLLLESGPIGAVNIPASHRDDILKACQIATRIGEMDIGQGAVVCRGLVLAVEAQEGTDAMLKRVARLPEAIRGTEQKRAGVLAKMVKPGQETRVDLPTIGLETVDIAVAAGLAGIVAEAGRAFLLNKDAVVASADAAGIFVAGLPPSKT